MATVRLTVEIRLAWWWTWLYWPLTLSGLWLGLPLDEERVRADFQRAVRVRPAVVRAF